MLLQPWSPRIHKSTARGGASRAPFWIVYRWRGHIFSTQVSESHHCYCRMFASVKSKFISPIWVWGKCDCCVYFCVSKAGMLKGWFPCGTVHRIHDLPWTLKNPNRDSANMFAQISGSEWRVVEKAKNFIPQYPHSSIAAYYLRLLETSPTTNLRQCCQQVTTFGYVVVVIIYSSNQLC